ARSPGIRSAEAFSDQREAAKNRLLKNADVVSCPPQIFLEETHGPDQVRADRLSAERSPHPPSPRQQDRPGGPRLPADAEAAQHDRAAEIPQRDGSRA